MSQPLSVSMLVQGRFHAFDLSRALIEQGVTVRLYTNYPAFKAVQFGVPAAALTCCPMLGLVHRYSYRFGLVERCVGLERLLHEGFSRWAARGLRRHETDIVHAFTGVALESYRDLEARGRPVLRLLTRGSAHIRDQFKELHQESRRAGTPIEMPSAWMMRRELQEYQVAHHIVTLSSYARDSFIRRGYPAEKVLRLSLGSDFTRFRPARDVIEKRLARIRSGSPLQVVYAGNISLQKGIRDMIQIAKELAGVVKFRLVGNITPDAASFMAASAGLFEHVERVPEAELPRLYGEADVFVFPTLHDGFAAVLAQAKAACLPVICTQNCAGPDLIEDNRTGWVLPARRPDQFAEKLRAYDLDRASLAAHVENLWQIQERRDWSQVAEDFVQMAHRAHEAAVRMR